jgi:putative two-component system response regulator
MAGGEMNAVMASRHGSNLVKLWSEGGGNASWQTALIAGFFVSIWPDAPRGSRYAEGERMQRDEAMARYELIAHSRRMAHYVEALALRLYESRDARRADAATYAAILGAAANFHDIGKLTIPVRVLRKPGRLDDSEFKVIKNHATAGANMIGRTQGRFPSLFVQVAREMAACHHERWNGTGYPFGLKGGEIPRAARIAAIADVYDAVSHDRVYQCARNHREAVGIIERGRGTDFDPQLVDLFLQVSDDL